MGVAFCPTYHGSKKNLHYEHMIWYKSIEAKMFMLQVLMISLSDLLGKWVDL